MADELSRLEEAAIIVYGVVNKCGKQEEFSKLVEERFAGKKPQRETVLAWIVGKRAEIFETLGIKEEA